MIEPLQYQILRRLVAHGEPVQKTTGGFELDGGEFLCRMTEMSKLKTLGLVEKLGNTHFGLTDAGRKVAARKDIWEMTLEEYFHDQVRVQDDVSVESGSKGFTVRYDYADPHPAGPFKGVAVIGSVTLRSGDSYMAPFGMARVTSVSKERVSSEKMDLMDVIEAAKDLHRRSVFDAVQEGMPVRIEVLALYIDLAPMLMASDTETEEGMAPR